jgi:hypothetical protein
MIPVLVAHELRIAARALDSAIQIDISRVEGLPLELIFPSYCDYRLSAPKPEDNPGHLPPDMTGSGGDVFFSIDREQEGLHKGAEDLVGHRALAYALGGVPINCKAWTQTL